MSNIKALVILGLGLLIGLVIVLGMNGSRDGLDVQVPLDAGVRLERTGLPDAAARARKSAVPAPEAAVGQERAAVGAGAQLQVLDEAGAPVADAVLAIELDASAGRGALESADAEGLPKVERVTADAKGRIALSSLPRAGDWYVSAPGFDWSAVDAGDREVLLERLPLARIEAVDVRGQSSFSGKRVRWLGDPALTRLFPWMETIGAWRVMGPGALEWGRLPRFGLNAYVGLDWELDERCTMVFAGLDVERLTKNETGWVSEVAYRLPLRRHLGHALPRLVFLDAAGAPRESARVRLWCNGMLVRDAVTDDNGVVPIDFHMADETEVAADLRIELLMPGAEPLVATGDLSDLRAAGEWVFDGERKALVVRVETEHPLEFSVAHAALHQGGAGAPHLMDAAESNAHLSMESLRFVPLDAAGRATITSQSLVGSHCVILRHDATGLLVMGQCGMLAGQPVVMQAPQLCDLTAVPGAGTGNEWRVEFDGKSSQFGGSFLIETGAAPSLSPGRQTLRLPFGRYLVQLHGAHSWLEESSLYLEQAQQQLPIKIPELRLVHAQLTRNFPKSGFPERVVLQRHTDRREMQRVDRDGRFDVWVDQSMELSEMAIGVTLPGESYQAFWIHPKRLETQPDEDARLVYSIDEARLRVRGPRTPFADAIQVTVLKGESNQAGTHTIRGGEAVFDLAPGTVELTTNVNGAPRHLGVELVAGEELRVDWQTLAVGAVRLETDLPLGAEVSLVFTEAAPDGFDPEADDNLNFFRTTLRVEPERFESRAFDFLAQAALYDVRVRVSWAAGYLDTITTEAKMTCAVRAGEVQTLRVDLLDKLLENLAREAEGNPELSQVLSELGG